jgi:hypothetical protein
MGSRYRIIDFDLPLLPIWPDLLCAGLQEFPNPTDSCGLVYGPTGAILAFDRRSVLKKQQDDLTLLLNSFGVTAATAAGV